MVSQPAEFCPDCGTALETRRVEGRDRQYCGACDRVVWHDPVPCAGVAVVDRRPGENAVLCVERARSPGAGEWTIPGGHLDVGEEPAAGAARELAEETGLVVDPDDLALFDATALPPEREKHVVSILYVADRADAGGEVAAGDDAAAARFWTPSAFDDADETFRAPHRERFRRVAALEEWRPAGEAGRPSGE